VEILKHNFGHLSAHHPVFHHYPELPHHLHDHSGISHDYDATHYVVNDDHRHHHHNHNHDYNNYNFPHYIKPQLVHSDEIISHPEEHLAHHNILHHVPEVHQKPFVVYSNDPHRVTEAHEDLMKLLANHKVVERHANHDELEALLGKLRNNTSEENNLREKASLRRVKRRSLFGFFGFSRSTSDDDHNNEEEADSFHATVFTNEDKWLAGCLMQCVFNKNGALDKLGYPTLDGLVELYTSGTIEQKFFVHVLRSVDKCLKIVSVKYHIDRKKLPIKGELCEVAFDIFDCVSDSIIDYCNG
jgi:PBP/GOBP family